MTQVMRVNLVCPCCSHEFESMAFASTNSFGPMTTELRRHASGLSPLPLTVHGCERCGYAGSRASFSPERASPELKEWVQKNLGLRLDGFPSWAKYENAARIAEFEGLPQHTVAHVWLRAAWCEAEQGKAGDRYRREALTRYEAALEQGLVPKEELPVVTYLAGELNRRTGNAAKARAWFSHVPDAVGGQADAGWLIDLAIQQSVAPKEFVEEEDDGAG